MALLEDRMLRIIELKEQGYEISAIAQELGLSQTTVDNYYRATQEAFREYAKEGISIESIAQENNLSPLGAAMICKHYMTRVTTQTTEENGYNLAEILRQEIQKYIAENGKSIRAFSRESGVNAVVLSKFLNRKKSERTGKERGLSIENAALLAHFFGFQFIKNPPSVSPQNFAPPPTALRPPDAVLFSK
jgi:transposase-like protein